MKHSGSALIFYRQKFIDKLRAYGKALFKDVEKRLFKGSTSLQTALRQAVVVEVESPALIVLLVRGPAPVAVVIDK